MLVPHENYISVMILRGVSNRDILRRLNGLGIIQMNEEDLEHRRDCLQDILTKEQICDLPTTKEDYRKRLEDVSATMTAMGYTDLLEVFRGNRNAAWDMAMSIMIDPKVRTALQAFILLEESPEYILSTLLKNFGYSCTQEAVDLFKKYFWNLVPMTRGEIFMYISNYPSKKARTILTDAYYKRPLTVKWTQAKESTLDMKTILQEVMNESFLKFRDLVKSDDKADTNVTAKWAALAIQAAEKFERLSSKSNKDLLDELKFELETKKAEEITRRDKFDGEIV